ncbi:hypothetical protein NM688_g6991 [Phlebia brevispora]|uniref:Uncharacterized protein n=1 Tax=Phlebia brevispora TaxID=194682 RepID=A0ACC1SA85_9APHY|nr:hypothetical protein NM688_g6991 [Phlebia brevispora]
MPGPTEQYSSHAAPFDQQTFPHSGSFPTQYATSYNGFQPSFSSSSETTTTVRTFSSPAHGHYGQPVPGHRPTAYAYAPFPAPQPPYPANYTHHFFPQSFAHPADASHLPYQCADGADTPPSPTPAPQGRKRNQDFTAQAAAQPKKRSRRSNAKAKKTGTSQLSEDVAASATTSVPIVPGVGPSQTRSNDSSSSTAMPRPTFNSVLPKSKESQLDVASDVWYFVQPLTTSTAPSNWTELCASSSETRLQNEASRSVCWLSALDEWKVWKTTGMTSTIRAHLQKYHYNQYVTDVVEHQLKGYENVGKARTSDDTANGRKTFDPNDHEGSLCHFHDLLARWIAVDDQSFNCVECPEFREMILYLSSDLGDEDLPHRTRLTELIMERFNTKKADLMKELQSAEGRISFTSDVWSNMKLTSFMAITAHFSAYDERGNLTIKSRLIAFRALSNSHTGENLASVCFEVLQEYGILHKAGEVTLDNASNNNTMMVSLQRLFTAHGIPFDHEQNRIRCFPHVINIAAKTGLKQLTKIPKESRNKDEDEETTIDNSVPHLEDGEDPSDPGDFGIDAEDNVHLRADILYLTALEEDPVALTRAIVNACRASGERRHGEDYRNTIKAGNDLNSFSRVLEVLELLRDVVTRWSATFLMINRYLASHEAVEVFLGKAKYQKIRAIPKPLNDDQLQVLADIRDFLHCFHTVQEVLSAERTPTLPQAIPVYEHLLELLRARRKELAKIAHGLNASIRKLQKYVKMARKTRIYALAMGECLVFCRDKVSTDIMTVIHPMYKFTWIEENWTLQEQADAKMWVKESMIAFRRTMSLRPTKPLPSRETTQPSRAAQKQMAGLRQLSNMLRQATQHVQVSSSALSTTTAGLQDEPQLTPEQAEVEHRRLVEEEFARYIADGILEDDGDSEYLNFDLCRYWQQNRLKYPTLFRIALDVMPVQASAVPCERVFSSSKETFTARRTNLSPVHMEVLQIMKYLIVQEREGLNFSDGRLATEEDLLLAESLLENEQPYTTD